MAHGRRILLSPMPNNLDTVELVRVPDDEVSVLDILDHVLNAGVVVQGSLVISYAVFCLKKKPYIAKSITACFSPYPAHSFAIVISIVPTSSPARIAFA